MEGSRRIWLLPQKGQCYKANLHCHTTVSDGAFTPLEIKKMYQERGYHAVAFTDHVRCVPHPELTDESFVALTGLEIAFGLRVTKTSIHLCGIARDPEKTLTVENEVSDELSLVNEGIALLRRENMITTLNHPLWSGMSTQTLLQIPQVDQMEAVNGYEEVQDGYGNALALFEGELRRGRRVRPVGGDDSHTAREGGLPGYEYFHGFTGIKAESLSYDALIRALDEGAFFASTGPEFQELYLEGDELCFRTSGVRGVYVHGSDYRHRTRLLAEGDTLTEGAIPLPEVFRESSYLLVRLERSDGTWAVSSPYYFFAEEEKDA